MRNRLFHASKTGFRRFDPDRIGSGAEANSALGVWLSVEPQVAWDYARGGALMVVETGSLRLATASDRKAMIWGGPDLFETDREIGWVAFDSLRRALLADGYDGVWCEMPGTDLEGAVCILDPSRLEIVEVLERPAEDLVDRLEGALEAAVFDFCRDACAELAHHRPAMDAVAGALPTP